MVGRWTRGLPALVGVLALAACGGSATPSSGPSTSSQPLTVDIAQSTLVLTNTGIYVAIEKGYFADANVTVKLSTLQSGAVTTQALASRSVDIAASGPFDIGTGSTKGVPFMNFVVTSNLSLEVCASKQLVAKKGLTTSSTPQQVMAAFKGGTFGITGAGSSPDLTLRYMLQKIGGLKPDTDVKIVALGSVPAELTAMERGQIDGFLQSPPACEQAAAAGTGQPILRPSRVTEFRDMPFSGLVCLSDFAKTHKDLLTRVATAIGKGNDFARQQPDETLTILHKYFPTVDQALMRDAFLNVAQPALAKDGKSTAAGWSRVSDLLQTSGAIDKPMNTKEGVLWSNAYIDIH